MGYSVLLVDDSREALELLCAEFEGAGYRVARAANGAQGWERFQQEAPDLVVTDVRMPDGDGFELLRRIRQRCDTPVILLTAYAEVALAVSAIRSGADDYLRFPHDLDQLLPRAEALLGRGGVEPDDDALRRLPGSGPAIRTLRERVRALAPLNVPVLIEGEPDAGRSRVARAVHALSAHAALPLVWLDGERFEMPAEPCVAVVREAERMPDAAMARCLDAMVAGSGAVRRWLFCAGPLWLSRYDGGGIGRQFWAKASRFPLKVPNLRARLEDVEAIARAYASEHARNHGRDAPRLTPHAVAALREHAWQGNLRELRDVVGHAVAYATGPTIGRQAMQDAIDEIVSHRVDILAFYRAEREAAQARELEQLLIECRGNIAEIGRRCGVTRGTIVYRLKKHGLTLKRKEGPAARERGSKRR
jgi:DNA-binding NtrC family response regulator